MDKISKSELIDVFREWVNKRPGLDPRDYGAGNGGDWRTYYNQDARMCTQQRSDALVFLNFFERSQMTAENVVDAFEHSFSGRLSLKYDEKRGWHLEYCTGQYYPTEYRNAAAAVLASAIWYYRRDDYKDCERIGDEIRKSMIRTFGKSIAKRWFN